MKRRAAAVLVATAAVLLAGRAEAQRRTAPPAPKPNPWYFRPLAYPTYDADDGLMGHVSVGWRHGANRLPPAVSKAVSVDTRFATSGTRGVFLTYDAPGWWRSWRILGQVGAERLQRAPFYGAGNNSTIADSLPTRFYRYSLLRTTALATVQRRVAGPLRLHAAAQWRHYHARPLGDTTEFAQFLAGRSASDSIPETILELRGGVLWDTRDFEASPSRGAFFEAMAVRSVERPRYTRWLLSAREFVPLGEFEQWVLAFQQTAELASGALPIPVAYERLTTWYPADGFGGSTSLRLYAPGRFVAPNRGLASADVRYKVLDAPFPTSPLRLWLLGFADVGRLWNQHERPTLSNLHWSAGVGVRIQFGKGSLFGVDVGRNAEGFGFAAGTSFAF